ncbi:MAG TPA: cation diffusion facilitator family transporter [Anaerohalosphaeraceae bacterium]|nr:cation diffusion facilitator family transporter [Anaerohalosphaeraceae bacterium]
MNSNLSADNPQIRRITLIGLWLNLFLSLLKAVVGFWAGSIGLVADAVHSLSDLLTDLAVLVGIHWGTKEPDSTHPFGHGRLETFSTAVIALVLGLVGGGMIYKAAVEIARLSASEHPASFMPLAVLWIAALSIISKEWLYQITRRTAIRCHSTTLYANAWHHRSDAFSSVAVLVGAACVRFLNYPYGDHLAAIVVGLMIIFVAVRIFTDCLNEFSEQAADQQTLGQIKTILTEQPRIAQWHQLRTRRVGREIFLDVHILVDPQLTITEAHAISHELEVSLHNRLPRPVNVIVHVEPDLPELRR